MMNKFIQIEMAPAAGGRGGFFHTEADFLLDNFKAPFCGIEVKIDTGCSISTIAERLFVFGTGESQYAAAHLMKRIFMSVNRFFVPVYGRSELTMALEDIKTNDVLMLSKSYVSNICCI